MPDTFDLRRLREDFGATSGFTDAQLLAGQTVPATADATPAPYRPSPARLAA
jgi:hypothetical protein